MKHTPGPWKVGWTKHGKLGDNFDDISKIPTVTTYFSSQWKGWNGSEAKICEITLNQNSFAFLPKNKHFEYDITEKECEANAHLIAAAPELLEAAESLLIDALDRGECHDEETGEMYDDWKALSDAIAKAKGG